MKLSIIYPVCSMPDPSDPNGKPHPFMLDSLDSVLAGGSENFELLVGIDGKRPWIKSYLEYWTNSRQVNMDLIRVFEFPFSGTYGNRQRNILMKHAKGDFICFMDQDDIFVKGALHVINKCILKHPKSPHIFKMMVNMFGDHMQPFSEPIVLWNNRHAKEIKKGVVGGHMFVAPNDVKLSEWPEDIYEADYHFIKNTCDSHTLSGVDVVWNDEVIASTRPWARHYQKHKR